MNVRERYLRLAVYEAKLDAFWHQFVRLLRMQREREKIRQIVHEWWRKEKSE